MRKVTEVKGVEERDQRQSMQKNDDLLKGTQGSYRNKRQGLSMIVIRHFPGGTEENKKTSQGSWCLN
jgi:hypothetical protein